ncbi:MAG: aminoglycoside phosphotransferase family protein [Sedimenticola sp.]
MSLSEISITDIARAFATQGEPIMVSPVGEGLINDSYLVKCPARQYLLQRINTRVFQNPAAVMQNIARVTGHLAEKARQRYPDDWQRRVLTLVPTCEDEPMWQDGHGNCWRMYPFIENSRTLQSLSDPGEAYSAAHTFGGFVRELADLPPPTLHETIPAFHDTPARLARLEAVINADPVKRRAGAEEVTEKILSYRKLTTALGERQLPLRTVHNDTKINNVLFDASTGDALCVVDLDTVMPGLALHDFGDLVRSAASVASADGLRLDITLYEALLRGWVDGTGEILTRDERSMLWIAPQVITLELAIRFLTDHLEGDRYFKTDHPTRNLERAEQQLSLLRSIQAQERLMRSLSDSVSA